MKKLSIKVRLKADVTRRRLERQHIKRSDRRRAKRLGRTPRHFFAATNGLPYDPMAAREQIILPKIFSLHKNYDETVSAIVRVREVALHQRRPVMLHFARVEEIEPAAALALVSEVHRAKKLRHTLIVSGTYPPNANVYEALNSMGFFSVLNIVDIVDRPEQKLDPRQPVFLRFISDNRVLPALADSFVSLIEKHIFSMNALARGRLVAAIKEAMNNTLDHAHPETIRGETMPHRWWMSSWINLAAKEVTIVFFDQGVGIPKTLKPDKYERIIAALKNITKLKFSAIPGDGEMIAAATEYHRSSKDQNGGRGFQDMKQFINACQEGELRVLSNRGNYYYVSKDEEGYSSAAQSLGGTVIQWRFRNEGKVEMIDA